MPDDTHTAVLAHGRHTIDVEQVTRALTDVVATDPDRVDPRRRDDWGPIQYVHRGEPACLVAMTLLRLGYSLVVLQELDREYPMGEIQDAGVTIADSRHPALRKLHPAARALLDFVQQGQDKGHRWRDITTAAFAPRRLRLGRLDTLRRPWLYVK